MQFLKSSPKWTRSLNAYWTTDGLPDLFVGLVFLLTAGWQTLTTLYPNPPFAYRAAYTLIILAAVLGGRWIIQRMKWQLTYPRTGYVGYKSLNIFPLMLLTGAAACLFAYLVLKAPPSSLLLSLTAVLTGLWAWIGWLNLSKRYFVYAAITALSGGLSWWALPQTAMPWQALLRQGTGVFLAVGLNTLIGGAWTFHRYLRRHPLPQEDVPHA
ncbi:MAG: hypothetical protein GXO56_04770 [Chloroflexi bacterium]|nr:hypothetical protein [Chloroflexota bacterium]